MSIKGRTAYTRGVVGLCQISIGLSLMACMGMPAATPNPSNPIRSVAVLQLVNNTNDVDAPSYVRNQLAEEVARHAYVVRPIPEVDQLLKDQMGISLGKQFDMTTPQQLGTTLGVDGVLYGSLEDFSHTVTGVTNEKRVRIRVKLVNCKTGETVWSNGLGIHSASGGLGSGAAGALLDDSSRDLPPLFGTPIQATWVEHSGFGGGGILGNAVAGFGEKVVMGAMSVPLYSETKEVVNGVLRSMPAGPGHSASPLDLSAPRTEASTTSGTPSK